MKQHMIEENEKTVLLRDNVYDLMEDFKANRVRMGNVMHVQSKLDKIGCPEYYCGRVEDYFC